MVTYRCARAAAVVAVLALTTHGLAHASSSPQYVATWNRSIWGLPNGVLPAGPVMGQGDFGMTLQTNNNTGCIEMWLGETCRTLISRPKGH